MQIRVPRLLDCVCPETRKCRECQVKDFRPLPSPPGGVVAAAVEPSTGTWGRAFHRLKKLWENGNYWQQNRDLPKGVMNSIQKLGKKIGDLVAVRRVVTQEIDEKPEQASGEVVPIHVTQEGSMTVGPRGKTREPGWTVWMRRTPPPPAGIREGSGAFVFKEGKGQFKLRVGRRTVETGKNLYFVPSGERLRDESGRDCAKRAAKEQTGLEGATEWVSSWIGSGTKDGTWELQDYATLIEQKKAEELVDGAFPNDQPLHDQWEWWSQSDWHKNVTGSFDRLAMRADRAMEAVKKRWRPEGEEGVQRRLPRRAASQLGKKSVMDTLMLALLSVFQGGDALRDRGCAKHNEKDILYQHGADLNYEIGGGLGRVPEPGDRDRREGRLPHQRAVRGT